MSKRGKNRVDRDFLYSKEKSRDTGSHFTPAISLSDGQYVTGYAGGYVENTGALMVYYEMPDQLVGERTEQRPISVHRKISASGWEDPTSFYHIGSQWSVGPTTFYFGYDPDNYASLYGDGANWAQRTYLLPDFPSYLETSAVNKALASLKNQQVNLSTAFLERKETAELAVSACKVVANLTDVFTGHLPDFLKRGNGWVMPAFKETSAKSRKRKLWGKCRRSASSNIRMRIIDSLSTSTVLHPLCKMFMEQLLH